MKQIAFFIAILSSGSILAQEIISPLITNPSLYNGTSLKTRASELNTLDSTFVYNFESISIEQAWDDFSVNRFEQFNAGYADVGVTSELFHHLMDPTNTTPQDADLIFCDSLFAHNDTIKIIEGLVVEDSSYYLFAPFDVWENDLDFYPVSGELIEGVFQECYILIDSIIDGVLDLDQDTVWYNANPIVTMVQDSARVFSKTVADTNLWIDNYACHNYTYAYNPWSLGVATFDGLDENGRPYEFGDESAHGIADYLTSRPIDLSGIILTDPEQVYLTFIYQAKGFGNMPEEDDSLIVEFWNEAEDVWFSATSWYGLADEISPNEWDTARIAVPVYTHTANFQFRFKNYASLSGALDHWHIDYVSLEVDPEAGAGNFSDNAIMYPVNSLIQDYTAVPWDHYKNTTGTEKMLTEFDYYDFNSDFATATSFITGEWSVLYEGASQGAFTISGSGSIDDTQFEIGLNECVVDMGGTFFYDQSLGGDQAKFDYKIEVSVGGSNKYVHNDTTYGTQSFDNYYAYDDGSAEAAYGITGVGSLFAYKFEAYEAGELTGVLMQFQPSVTDLSGEVFLLTVWSDDGGQPGDIIYQDDYFESHFPAYSGSKDGFKYFTFYNDDYLTDGYLSVNETFYVGWQKIGGESLNIGLDWNIDNGSKVFRNTAGEWVTSSYEMSLLIRPVFSTALDYTLSNERETRIKQEINLYPNPTADRFTLSGLSGNYQVTVFDMSGRIVTSVQNQNEIDVTNIENGVYIVTVKNNFDEIIHSSKLIKR